MTLWTPEEAITLCRLVEPEVAKIGFHVALTGGLLYKEGPRKDCDLLFYGVRQQTPDFDALIDCLQSIGFAGITSHGGGFVLKTYWMGKSVDCLLPEVSRCSSSKY